jgi:hypothetical protein
VWMEGGRGGPMVGFGLSSVESLSFGQRSLFI